MTASSDIQISFCSSPDRGSASAHPPRLPEGTSRGEEPLDKPSSPQATNSSETARERNVRTADRHGDVSVHGHRGEYPPLGAASRGDAGGADAPRRPPHRDH